jgi:hypothetical protein
MNRLGRIHATWRILRFCDAASLFIVHGKKRLSNVREYRISMGSNPAYMPFSYNTTSLETLECQAAPINPPLALSCRATNAKLHTVYGTSGESASAEMQCKSCLQNVMLLPLTRKHCKQTILSDTSSISSNDVTPVELESSHTKFLGKD